MAAAAAHRRRAGRREVTAEHPKVKRARDLKAQELTPAGMGKVIGAGRATAYRYLSLKRDWDKPPSWRCDQRWARTAISRAAGASRQTGECASLK